MTSNMVAGGPKINGARIHAFNSAAFAMYGRICHLCGSPGADTVDHLVPVSVAPELLWDIDNVRPAHRTCNSVRRDAPLAREWGADW